MMSILHVQYMEVDFRKRNNSKRQRLSKEKQSQTLTPAKGVGGIAVRSGLIFHRGPRKDTGIGNTGKGATGLN